MGQVNWNRVFLGGLVTAVVGGLLYVGIMFLSGEAFASALEAKSIKPLFLTKGGFALFLAVWDLLTGVWAVWLYAAIRPRFGPGPKTAAVAGAALWFFASLVDAWWIVLGVVPPGTTVIPILGALPATIVATIAGAWVYQEEPGARPESAGAE